MDIFLIILAVIALLSITYFILVAPRMFNRPDYSILKKYHYAHRGLFDNASNAPENSLAAFKKATENGYGIELDIQLSSDNVPVVFHDATLTRMCGIDKKVSDCTLAELKTYKLGTSTETIPTFCEALNVIGGKTPIIVEYKLYSPDTLICKLANGLLRNYTGDYCIESFHPKVLMWYKKHQPDIVRGQLSMSFWKQPNHRFKPYNWILTALLTNVATRPDFIAYKHSDAGNFSRNVCRRLGALSAAWTIRTPEAYEKSKKKFDIFIFDSTRL